MSEVTRILEAAQPGEPSAANELLPLGWNTVTTIPFKRQAGIGIAGSVFDAGNLQLKGKDSAAFWCYAIVFGYEPAAHEDGDPDSEEPSLGINADDDLTTLQSAFCVAYVESIRDKEWGLNRDGVTVSAAGFTNNFAGAYQAFYFDRLYGAIGHERRDHPHQPPAWAPHLRNRLWHSSSGNRGFV